MFKRKKSLQQQQLEERKPYYGMVLVKIGARHSGTGFTGATREDFLLQPAMTQTQSQPHPEQQQQQQQSRSRHTPTNPNTRSQPNSSSSVNASGSFNPTVIQGTRESSSFFRSYGFVAVIILSFCYLWGIAAFFIQISTSGFVAVKFAGESVGTVPVGLSLTGSAIFAAVVPTLNKKMGFRASYTLGLSVGTLGALLNMWSTANESFLLLCIGAFLQGMTYAYTYNLRFLVLSFTPKKYASRAIALVIAGATISVIGPELSRATKDSFSYEYMGSYLSAAAIYFAFLITFNLLRFRNQLVKSPQRLEKKEKKRMAKINGRCGMEEGRNVTTNTTSSIGSDSDGVDLISNGIGDFLANNPEMNKQSPLSLAATTTTKHKEDDSEGEEPQSTSKEQKDAMNSSKSNDTECVEDNNTNSCDKVADKNRNCMHRNESDSSTGSLMTSYPKIDSTRDIQLAHTAQMTTISGSEREDIENHPIRPNTRPVTVIVEELDSPYEMITSETNRLPPLEVAHSHPSTPNKSTPSNGSDTIGMDNARPRSLKEILKQPRFLVAVMVCAVSFSGMAGLMNATPLAMSEKGHSFAQTTTSIQIHMVGMFLPAVISGDMIGFFGILPNIYIGLCGFVLGVGLYFVGNGFVPFTIAYFFIGIGWSFGFVAGTRLLTTCYSPNEQSRAVAFNEAVMLGSVTLLVMVASSTLSSIGWHYMLHCYMALFLLTLVVVVVYHAFYHAPDALNPTTTPIPNSTHRRSLINRHQNDALNPRNLGNRFISPPKKETVNAVVNEFIANKTENSMSTASPHYVINALGVGDEGESEDARKNCDDDARRDGMVRQYFDHNRAEWVTVNLGIEEDKVVDDERHGHVKESSKDEEGKGKSDKHIQASSQTQSETNRNVKDVEEEEEEEE
eukprot:m.150033 g.150033  ORF g.150033 m.150033 type:complete len:901 (+) comp13277_c0_seq3:3859-6561(+)